LTSWASLERSVTGLLTDLPQKHCDTIAAAWRGPPPHGSNICEPIRSGNPRPSTGNPWVPWERWILPRACWC